VAVPLGIRVIPEFDIPGHAGWFFGHPEITISVPAACHWNPLDPTLDRTYTFLHNFLDEMATIFTVRKRRLFCAVYFKIPKTSLLPRQARDTT
jgi:N-acetyl-beta-hexosaminidase